MMQTILLEFTLFFLHSNSFFNTRHSFLRSSKTFWPSILYLNNLIFFFQTHRCYSLAFSRLIKEPEWNWSYQPSWEIFLLTFLCYEKSAWSHITFFSSLINSSSKCDCYPPLCSGTTPTACTEGSGAVGPRALGHRQGSVAGLIELFSCIDASFLHIKMFWLYQLQVLFLAFFVGFPSIFTENNSAWCFYADWFSSG